MLLCSKMHDVHMNIQLILTILNQNLIMKQQRMILMKAHLIIPPLILPTGEPNVTYKTYEYICNTCHNSLK